MTQMRKDPINELPDDYCEVCCRQPADIECAHGLLCKPCAVQVHGGNECCDYNEYPEDAPRKKVWCPIIISRWFRTHRSRRVVNARFDATEVVEWNFELGPSRRPWIHVKLDEFQMVYWLRIRFRGKTIFEHQQSQAWESKNRRWIFNEWLLDWWESRYEAYEHSMPEDPYGSLGDYE